MRAIKASTKQSSAGPKRIRIALALTVGAATWVGLIWLARMFLPVPDGAIVVMVVLVVTMGAAGFFLPLSGFGTGSAAIGISVIAGSIVAVGLMHTPVSQLVIGSIVIALTFTPALVAGGLVHRLLS